mmetsp:Transcript_13503/g.36424  ORF Transcript_13503/g.36424 Transcript_13503/m.36424 type:complete len:216 (-) Transcript_13503:18-665(-)
MGNVFLVVEIAIRCGTAKGHRVRHAAELRVRHALLDLRQRLLRHRALPRPPGGHSLFPPRDQFFEIHSVWFLRRRREVLEHEYVVVARIGRLTSLFGGAHAVPAVVVPRPPSHTMRLASCLLARRVIAVDATIEAFDPFRVVLVMSAERKGIRDHCAKESALYLGCFGRLVCSEGSLEEAERGQDCQPIPKCCGGHQTPCHVGHPDLGGSCNGRK